ncbi:protease Lon-related BREX system protein BrxL [Companilactobacillus ginsenosidimutans]|uniref:ATP-dependent Lon protease n=1 Tax=Companilactobacillus ginsenosidimutans TaxID=1007676 RepID=A0A0H4QKE9_9LACO|nr:protease Lon-related BREX system protein BrxL [Companilactobacillus ginsenosidimutans]AKP67173.1 ATP-dependent Lon protease [Companilactobacillus ginsenosidimutans]
MTDSNSNEATNDVLLDKLIKTLPGKFVRKDLTNRIKEGANVPTYVLEYLLGMYANSTDEAQIERGVENVKKTLANNYVRPDEAEKVKSKIRELGSYTVIDKLTVHLNEHADRYEALFSNLGIDGVPVDSRYPQDFERLLGGGIWSIVRLRYAYDENNKNESPFVVDSLTPIQVADLNMPEVYKARSEFTTDEWTDLILRTIGMEPTQFSKREKWLFLARLIPFVENNYNVVELGPRGTGKSHVYKELSPNSILVSGGQTTVANLFYNMGRRQVGLVGMWDIVAFDEVAGITFKDKDGVQIMKDYMASGSFARGKDEIQASAAMVFVGNINQSIDVVMRTSNLFEPFPEVMATDSAFLDRIHAYIPGWEIPKYKPSFFTKGYGLITDYFAEIMRELRKQSFSDAIDKYFKLGGQLNQRDTIAVRKTTSGMLKLLYPNGEYGKPEVQEALEFALELRRRVKEQLKKIGGMEFFDINFSYIDNETFEEHYVSVPEQGSNSLIPEGTEKPGQVYTVTYDKNERLSLFKIETQMIAGNGKFEKTGISGNHKASEAMDTAYKYLKANSKSVSSSISLTTHDYVVNAVNLNNSEMTSRLSLATYIALVSISMSKSTLDSLVILGEHTIGGSLVKLDNLADTLQVALDSGAKKILIPNTSAADLGSVPSELLGAFTVIFYDSIEDAAFKALGVK